MRPDHSSAEKRVLLSITRIEAVRKPVVRLSVSLPVLSLCVAAALAERTNDLAALQPDVSQAFGDTLHPKLDSAHTNHAIVVLRRDRFGEAVIKE